MHPEETKQKFIITAREMEQLEDLKAQLAQQTSFIQKFKMMNSTQQRNRSNQVFSSSE